jgi:hypothetical protein
MRHSVTDEQFLLAIDELRWLGRELKKLPAGDTEKRNNWERDFDRVAAIITTYGEERFERVFGEPKARRKQPSSERRQTNRQRLKES